MSINYVNCWCMHLNRFLSFRMKIAKGSTMTIRSQKICFAPVTDVAESIHALATLVDRCCAGKKTSLNMYIFVLLTLNTICISIYSDTTQLNQPWTIFGITSFGDGCGKRNKFGIYAKLPNYVNWIRSVMECDGYCNSSWTNTSGRNML